MIKKQESLAQAKQIVENIAKTKQYITYKELGDQLNPPLHYRSRELRELLDALSSNSNDEYGILLSSIVVLRSCRVIPGVGFISIMEKYKGYVRDADVRNDLRRIFDEQDLVFEHYNN